MVASRCAPCKRLSRQGRRKRKKLKRLALLTSLMKQRQCRTRLSRSAEKGGSDGAIKVAQVALCLGQSSLSLSATPAHATNAHVLAGAGHGSIFQRTLLSLFHYLSHHSPRGLSDQRRRPGHYGSGRLEHLAWVDAASNDLQYTA